MDTHRSLKILFLSMVSLCCLFAISWADLSDDQNPFGEPLISDEEMIQKKGWDKMTQPQLKQEHEKLQSDIELMEKRLKQLRGITRLNQDQYREKDILEELTYIKQRELRILEKLMKKSEVAPDLELPGTQEKDVSLP